MRRLATAFLFLALAASPAGAQDPLLERPRMPDPVEQAPPAPAPAPAPSLALVTPAPGPDRCLSGCSRSYYFCLALGDEACDSAWGKCRRVCTRPDESRPMMSSPLPLRRD